MKKGLLIIILYLLFFSLLGCNDAPDFNLSDIQINEVEVKTTSNVAAVISAYRQSELDVYTFDEDDETIISCYVISSDEAGNFYKTLVIQDQAENPMNGLEIKIDLRSYYTKYNFGRKIFIKLAGLSITEVNGKYILGYLLKGGIVAIPTALLNSFIIRSLETKEIVPVSINLKNYSKNMINTFVALNEIQFLKTDIGKTFSSEAYDTYNGERIIEQCPTLERTTLFTSVYAKFKSNLLPIETFRLQAILSSDYYSGSISLILNNLQDITITAYQRCDPLLFECPETNGEKGKSAIFYEDFDAIKTTVDIEKTGWKNINVNFGSDKFRKRSSKENTYVQVSAYGTDEYVMDAWLISPEIDLTLQKGVLFSFDTRATFEEGTVLTVWFSTDYSGDFYKSNWQQVNANISVGSRDGGNKTFLNSGEIPMACIQQKIHLAFRYLGADPGISTTYDIDNVLILGN